MEALKKILVIEDQADIGSLIALNLESMDFHVDHALSGLEGYKQAQSDNYDAIILDVMLPEMSGLKVCEKLRSSGYKTPILMLTAKKSEADRVVGLEVGADDYLTKPFSVRELQARIKALLRRVSFHDNKPKGEDAPLDEETPLRFGDLTIEIHKRKVEVNNTEIPLTVKEFDLLLYMATYPGKVFTRDQLLNAVWGYRHSGYEHTVNSHINRLRSKLEPVSGSPRYVLTVWGVGYKFFDE